MTNPENFMRSIDPTCQFVISKRRKAIELIMDPASGQLSMSRLCLGAMTATVIPLACVMAYWGAYTAVSVIIPGVVASICGVYWGSTRKAYKTCEE